MFAQRFAQFTLSKVIIWSQGGLLAKLSKGSKKVINLQPAHVLPVKTPGKTKIGSQGGF